MVPMAESASIFCARVVRGTSSIASAVTPVAARRAVPAGSSSGRRKPMSTCSPASSPSSSAGGGCTRAITRQAYTSVRPPMRAPAFSKSASERYAPSPAPCSTTTSTPSFTSRCTVSGTSATRRSRGAVSFGTPTLTGMGVCSGMRRGRSRGSPLNLGAARGGGKAFRELQGTGCRGRGDSPRAMARHGARSAALDPRGIALNCTLYCPVGRPAPARSIPFPTPHPRPMKTSEYLSVLVSIIVGLGMSQVLSGVANLLVDRRRVRFYWVWAVAVVMVFLANVQFWWSTFSVGDAVATNFFSFVYFLLTPIALYLSAVVIVPDFEGEGEIDLKRHFYANRALYFGLLAVVPLLSASRSILISGDPLFAPERPFEALFVVLLASGALVAREGYQKTLVVALVALFVAFIVVAGLQPG